MISAAPAYSQGRSPNEPWQRVDQISQTKPASEIWIHPDKFRAFNLNHAALREILNRAPREFTPQAAQSPTEVALPMPDGTFARFLIVESPVMVPELAAKFPEIKTYFGQGIDDPAATVRFDMTPAGFHAQILSPHGAVYIDPYWKGDANLHTSYYKRDYRRAVDFECLTPSGNNAAAARTSVAGDLMRSGSTLRTYRLACAATGEYTQKQGGTVAAGMSAIVTAINRVTGVYETELAIRLVLVANNDLLVYTNGSTDPYSNTSGSTMLGQNQANIDSIIGDANYDIGHVFSTGGGGIAGLGVVCQTGSKAHGVTGLPAPIGDAFYIDFVAHEMGHQFGANHPFNSMTGNCGGGNRNASTAYEPGSGSTIMAYAGICVTDNLQPHSDPYFHSISFDEIINYTTGGSGGGCPALTSTGNNAPTVNAGPSFVIPKGTPFTLTATGSDPDGDTLTFCWEERDLGSATTVTSPDNGSSPLFRSFNPVFSPSRTFPKLSDILNNTITIGEQLPTTDRTMNFRVTARDNRADGGGVNTADTQVTVTTAAGPFAVTSPDTAVTWSGTKTVTWNVAGTAGAPVNATNVNILLSTNGGNSFPITLAANTPNDGSETVLLPNIISSMARIKVEAAGNIFFAISAGNFTITNSAPAPFVVLESAVIAGENCGPANGTVDPDETVTVNFALKNLGSANTTNLVVTLLSTNGVTFPGDPQTYGALAAGGASVSMPFTFTASGICGGTIIAQFHLQDGATDLGIVSNIFYLGVTTVATTTNSNPALIKIPGTGTSGPGSPYPSTITVSGVAGMVTKVTVTLSNLTHTYPDDIDVLLVGPTGQRLLLMSDTGGASDVNNVTLTFDDTAAVSLPDSGQIISGTFKPTDFEVDAIFTNPAPAGPYGTTLSAFNGLNPNGTWSLYVVDDAGADTGGINGGWRLAITTQVGPVCCSLADLSVAVTGSPATINEGDTLTYMLTVTNHGPDTATGVTTSDTLPAGASFVSANASQGSCTNNGGVITCTLGTMTNAATATISITATANTPGTLTNKATVSATTSDPNSANNTATAFNSVNAPPAISGIADQTINEDTKTVALVFTIGDAETPATNLVLSVSSSNTNLVSVTNIVFGGSDSNRTVTITPSPDQFGSATIAITVSDGMATASNMFLLTVNSVNDAPTLDALNSMTIDEDAAPQTVNLAGISSGAANENQTLIVTAVSSNPSLIPDPVVNYTSPGGSGTLTFAPLTNANGSATITVTVQDNGGTTNGGQDSFSRMFLVTVNPVNDAPLLTAIPDQTIHEGTLLVITNTATDVDVPTNKLTFSLDAGAPNGAEINVTNGVFTWTPTEADVGSTNFITVRVTDDGTPNLSDAKTFKVVVVSRPIIESITVEGENVTLVWSAIAGKTYRVQYKSDLAAASWNDLTDDVPATGATASKQDVLGSDAQRFYRVVVLP